MPTHKSCVSFPDLEEDPSTVVVTVHACVKGAYGHWWDTLCGIGFVRYTHDPLIAGPPNCLGCIAKET